VSAGLEANHPVRCRTETSSSSICPGGSADNHKLAANTLLADTRQFEAESRLYAPYVRRTAFVAESRINETCVFHRLGSSPRIWPKRGQIGCVAPFWICDAVRNLSDVDGAYRAGCGRFIGGNSRPQQVGDGDGRGHQSRTCVEAAAHACFANGCFLSLNADQSRLALSHLGKRGRHLRRQPPELERGHRDRILIQHCGKARSVPRRQRCQKPLGLTQRFARPMQSNRLGKRCRARSDDEISVYNCIAELDSRLRGRNSDGVGSDSSLVELRRLEVGGGQQRIQPLL
jgi:hypothetical protein